MMRLKESIFLYPPYQHQIEKLDSLTYPLAPCDDSNCFTAWARGMDGCGENLIPENPQPWIHEEKYKIAHAKSMNGAETQIQISCSQF